MSDRIHRFLHATSAALVLLGMANFAAAQVKEGLLSGNIKYNSGQGVQPIFEGWTKNPEGGYRLYFGYLNRNHVEEVYVPVGPDNRIEPAGPDRGQPTYFYTRFNRQLFSVDVPNDFGPKQQIVWTLVVHGQTDRAVGWLRPDWEIAPPGSGLGSGRPGENPNNQPPTLALSGSSSRIARADTLTLTATVTDDGLPVRRAPRARGAADLNRPPAFDYPEFKATTPVNVPQVERPAPPRVNGRLQVSWLVWRGPGPVTFDPPAASGDDGKAVFKATFTKPGEYVLRARATDGAATTLQDFKVTITAGAP